MLLANLIPSHPYDIPVHSFNRTGSKWIMTSSMLSIFTWQKYLIPKNVAGWLRAYIRVLCNQCYEQLEVTLQVVLWHETFVNILKAVQIYFIDKFLW